ncbi:MAG: DNRLRE domain-containing protein [Fluviicola sp.]
MKQFIVFLVGSLISVYSFAQPTSTTLTPNADSYTNSSVSSGSYGGSTAMYSQVTAGSVYYRSFMNFSIPAFSANTVIYSAKLRLVPNGTENVANPGDLTLSLANASWLEGTITHSNQPAQVPTITIASIATSSIVSSKREFDVTAHVQAIADGRIVNNGWILRRTNETTTAGTTNYYTRENASNKPELIIQYYTPATVTAATLTHCTAPTGGTGSISPTVANGASTTRTSRWYNAAQAQIGTSLNITGLNPGWYGLKSYSSYAGDTVYQGFILGQQCQEVSVTVPTNSNYMQDATVSDEPNFLGNFSRTNSGSDPLIMGNSYAGFSGWTDAMSLMRFSLWVDPALVVTQAALLLQGNNHNATRSNESELARITAPWREYGVAFINKPASATDIVTNVPALPTGSANSTIQIANFFNYWKSANTSNYGMYFRLKDYSNTTASQTYHSSNSTTVAKRPTLTMNVEYINCDRTSFTQLKDLTDAGVATIYNNTLKFFFTEEYTIDSGKKLPLKIYNEDNVAIAGIDFNGVAISGLTLLPAINYVTDKNFVSLSLAGLSLTIGKFYTLELTNTLGEKKYLKFKYTN